MADKKKRGSVEEQRIRQQELIELKRQREAFKENPDNYVPCVSDSTEPKQSARSRLSNFWYYSRFTIIGCLVVAIFLGFAVSQCASKTKYDLTIVLYTKTYTNSIMSENLATVAEQYCEDYNGNGEVDVLVVNCSIPDSDRLHDSDASTRLLGQFQNQEAIVYIVDTGAFKDLKTSFGDDFLDDSLQLPDLDGTAFKLNGTVFDAAFESVEQGYTNKFDYYLLRRNVGDTLISDKKGVEEHSKNANAFIEAVLKNPYMNKENK